MASNKKTKATQVQEIRNVATITKVSGLDPASTLAATNTLALKIQKDLSQISEQFINKHAELQAIDDAIKLKKEEMEALHGADQILLSLDELRTQHEKEIAELQEAREIIIKNNEELEINLEETNKREIEQFDYLLQLNRKKEQDAWEEKLRLRGVQERDRLEQFEKNIANGMAALKASETEYQAAITKLASFDKEVEAAVGSRVGMITNNLKKEHEHQTQLLVIKHEAALNTLVHDNKRLVETSNSLEIQVKELQGLLKEAYAANAALAAKAVDGASDKAAQASAMSMLTNIGGPRNGQAGTRG